MSPLISRLIPTVLLGVLGLAGCSDGSDGSIFSGLSLSGCADSGDCVSNPPTVINQERPAQVLVPSDYNTATRYPLIVVLHGFGANGAVQAAYMGFTQRVDAGQYVMVTPDGTLNEQGNRFWNATEACCAFSEEDFTVDDVSYIRSLIEEAAATYSIDTNHIALFGHSNGGFMTLRMACEASDYVTTAVSLAGSTFDDPALCAPASNPVNVLLIHGDEDATILYEGSDIGGDAYPGAIETAERFAGQYGCDVQNTVPLADLDMIPTPDGAETERVSYPDCNDGVAMELWTITQGPHIPAPWQSAAQDEMVQWLLDNGRD